MLREGWRVPETNVIDFTICIWLANLQRRFLNKEHKEIHFHKQNVFNLQCVLNGPMSLIYIKLFQINKNKKSIEKQKNIRTTYSQRNMCSQKAHGKIISLSL